MNKSTFIENLLSKSGKSSETLSIDFEKELTNSSRPGGKTPTDITTFLDMPSPYDKSKIIEDTFKWINTLIDKRSKEIKNIFLNIHLSYYKNSEFFYHHDTRTLESIIQKVPEPHVKIITLIDDVFSIWQRIKKKENEVFLDTALRLREILAWRSLETLRSESLKTIFTYIKEGELTVNNFLVSIRHPYSTFENLIFNDNTSRVYLSFSITESRKTKEGTQEINQYRKELHQLGEKYHVSIFDPVTIDELSLVAALNEVEASEKQEVSLEERHRWPLEDVSPIVKPPSWPIVIPMSEIKEVQKDISNQISSRDYTLVDAGTILAAYRPYFNGIRSEGMFAEITHAKENGRRVVVYSPEEDEKKAGLAKSPFAARTDLYRVKGEFVERLLKLIS